MRNPAHICRECVYFEPAAGPQEINPKVGLPGVCRAHAPAFLATPDGLISGWPHTRTVEWCGEWSGERVE